MKQRIPFLVVPISRTERRFIPTNIPENERLMRESVAYFQTEEFTRPIAQTLKMRGERNRGAAVFTSDFEP